MPEIRLPDGSTKRFAAPVTVAEVAAALGAGLARAALAAEIDGRPVDLAERLEHDAAVRILTARDPEGLEILRHSTAHLLAQAVKRLYPAAQVTIGPVIEDGFYYDFHYPPGFNLDDLAAIEAEMQRLVKAALPVEREVVGRDEAVRLFRDLGEDYKAEIIASIPPGEEISLYRQGEFVDLCRGPHVPDTGRLGAFKLTRVAGAYWRGDSQNEMLQRIYGTAWADKKALAAHLERLAEAEKRDHRRLGRQLGLFHMQEEAPGMVFWHPPGWTLWQIVEQTMRQVYRAGGYQEVRCPQILDVSLWRRSGHWDNYQENMFFTQSENREYAVKPMNCPGHVQIYNHTLRSYRELPLRYGEFGSCHRNEPSGALHGLMRVRAFTQDDGHVFCMPSQIAAEVAAFHRQAIGVYAAFGFTDVVVKLALRPEKRLGDDAVWDRAEQALREALAGCGVRCEELPGEGAFYGPKIEYHLSDSLGRPWQLGTMQVDFMMPARLGADYVAEDNTRQVPVMLHRAIVGSMERFIGILIEHYGGDLPAWLAPAQALVMNITDGQADYVRQVVSALRAQGLRVAADLRNEKIGYKIREATLARIPWLLIAGEREKANGDVAVRQRGGKDLGAMPLAECTALLATQCAIPSFDQFQESHPSPQ